MIVREGHALRIENDWIRRKIEVAEQPATTVFDLRPNGKAGADVWIPLVWPGFNQPFEAIVRAEGRAYGVGPMNKAAGQGGEEVAGAFRVAEISIRDTALGQEALLRCAPRIAATPNLEVTLRYEIARDLPLLIKQVGVANRGDRTVRIDNLTTDAWTGVRYNGELRVFTDFYDAYGESSVKDEVYFGWMRREFPAPINYQLDPGAEFFGFRCFECATTNEADAVALLRARIVHRLAPWTTRPLVDQEIDTAGSREELLAVAPQAAANGVELCHLFINQLFTNIGDYIPRPDLFPDGADGLKRLADHFHRHGVKVLPYCSLTIAAQAHRGPESALVCREHEDWQYLGPGGVRYNCWASGNMCYQSGWGDYIKGKLRWLVQDLGFDGLHIDGPYHGLPCLEAGHRHRTPEAVFFMNWQFERELFAEWRRQGFYFTVPQDPAAILFGANAMPGGYTEEDHAAIGGRALVAATRARLYDARFGALPASCVWAYHALDPLHGHGIEASEEDPMTYEHSLAGALGNGYWGILRGRRLFVGPRTEAIFRKWIAFYKAHRATFCGGHVHLVRPDGIHPDAMLHVNPEAAVPAVLTLFNPAPAPADLGLALPLGHAGFAGGGQAVVEGQGVIALDARGTGVIALRLAPNEVRALEVRRTG